jgi:hypothetical protein
MKRQIIVLVFNFLGEVVGRVPPKMGFYSCSCVSMDIKGRWQGLRCIRLKNCLTHKIGKAKHNHGNSQNCRYCDSYFEIEKDLSITSDFTDADDASRIREKIG